jgi:diguanylate cyclase (GGDEF)-like protein
LELFCFFLGGRLYPPAAKMIHVDELTGAWDRGSFEYYLRNRLPQEQEGFGIIYCDVDHLKEINDSYGHREGDFAISTAVCLLREAIRTEDIIVRHGGDEFLVIVKSPFKKDLDHIVQRMEHIFDEYNQDSTKRYKLECSFGGDIFDKSYSSIDHFINYIDGLMYLNKNKKKNKEMLLIK